MISGHVFIEMLFYLVACHTIGDGGILLLIVYFMWSLQTLSDKSSCFWFGSTRCCLWCCKFLFYLKQIGTLLRNVLWFAYWWQLCWFWDRWLFGKFAWQKFRQFLCHLHKQMVMTLFVRYMFTGPMVMVFVNDNSSALYTDTIIDFWQQVMSDLWSVFLCVDIFNAIFVTGLKWPDAAPVC